jgi:hypothetical protein
MDVISVPDSTLFAELGVIVLVVLFIAGAILWFRRRR